MEYLIALVATEFVWIVIGAALRNLKCLLGARWHRGKALDHLICIWILILNINLLVVWIILFWRLRFLRHDESRRDEL